MWHLLFAICYACLVCNAQTEGVAQKRARRVPVVAVPAIRADIGLVEIPVTVTGPFGQPVSGLSRDAFRVYEDGVEQELKHVSFRDSEISLGIVFDASKSMASRLDESRAAMKHVFQDSIPGDEFLLVEFNDTARMVCDFTPQAEDIESAAKTVTPRNWTALYDAVYLAIQQMKRAHNPRRALLILSDGGDNNSRYTESEMRNLVREGGVTIYAVGVLPGGFLNSHERFLRRLAEETGGTFESAERLKDLGAAVEKVSRAIRSQYVLSYVSNNPKIDGHYRKVKVTLKPVPEHPPLRAAWKEGYYSIPPR